MALQRRQAPAGRQDPVRVRAVQIGIGIHHLRLQPQPELHAPLAYVARELVQAAGPDGFVDPPVTQAGLVAAATEEPAVVQDVPFRSDAGRPVGERGEPAGVVVEVDGFPHVEVDRSGRARVGGPRANVPVELRGQAVQAVPGGGEVDPRRGVGLVPRQRDLTGQQELAPADGGPPRQQPPARPGLRRGCGPAAHAVPGPRSLRSLRRRAVFRRAEAGGHPLDMVHGVAAPGHVQAEHLAAGEAEARHARDDHGGGIVPGVTAAAFAQPQPVGEPMALRDTFGRRPPGEVEHLAHPAGQREDEFQAVHQVRQAAGVGQVCRPRIAPPGTASISVTSRSPATVSAASTRARCWSCSIPAGRKRGDQSRPAAG